MRTPRTLEICNEGAIEIVALNRPRVLNALNEELTDDLLAYFEGLCGRTEVRVVILRATGRAFCAGLDLAAWKTPSGSPGVDWGWAVQRKIAAVMQAMRRCPQPIIACAQGEACGGGFSLVLASDIRLAAPDLRMNAAYLKIGLGGCDMGSSYFLPRLIGASLASEYLLTGRFMTAELALDCRLVSAIHPHVELLASARSLAVEMTENSPMGLRLTKDALNLNIDAPSMQHAFALEDRQQVMLGQSGESDRARTAFFEKRKGNDGAR